MQLEQDLQRAKAEQRRRAQAVATAWAIPELVEELRLRSVRIREEEAQLVSGAPHASG